MEELDSSYRIFIAKQKDQEKYAAAQRWIKRFPIKELIERGYLKGSDNINELTEQLLTFFSAGSLNSFKSQITNVAFRKSAAYQSKPESVMTWLRIGQVEAQNTEAPLFNRDMFTSNLKEIKRLTTCKSIKEMLLRTRELCLKSGVVVLYIEEIEQTRASGAAFWLTKDKPVIMLSSRYKTDDHFWFSFFHECGHLLNDSKKTTFIDYDDNEEDANIFAGNFLIPQKDYDEYFGQFRNADLNAIIVNTFAKKIGIAPGIVVGRLQKDKKIDYAKQYSNLQKKIDFKEINRT